LSITSIGRAYERIVLCRLSFPNLIAGVALLVLKHTLTSREPLQIINDFLFEVVWGSPLAALLFVLLLVFGILSNTRPYTAMFAFVLNAAGLALVLSRFRLPSGLEEAVFFLPVLLALIGFAWIAYPCFVPRPIGKSAS
jgi:hypothetical protein